MKLSLINRCRKASCRAERMQRWGRQRKAAGGSRQGPCGSFLEASHGPHVPTLCPPSAVPPGLPRLRCRALAVCTGYSCFWLAANLFSGCCHLGSAFGCFLVLSMCQRRYILCVRAVQFASRYMLVHNIHTSTLINLMHHHHAGSSRGTEVQVKVQSLNPA